MSRFVAAALLLSAAGVGGCSRSRARTPSAPPTNLTARACAPGSVHLGWQDNSSNETGFEIERRDGQGAFVLVGTTTANRTVHFDVGLSSATTYSYRVRAVNSRGPSDYTDQVAASTAAEGFVVFSRTTPSGGEDLYYASTDGLVAPEQITDNGASRLDAVDIAARGSGRWAVFAVDSDLHAAPLFCTESRGSSLRLAVADVFGPFAVFDDRHVVAVTATAGVPRLISADLDTAITQTLAEFPDGELTWHPPARSDSGKVYFSHRAAAQGGTSFSEVWAATPDGGNALTPVGDHGLRLDYVQLDRSDRPMLRGDSIILRECLGSSCAVWSLTIAQPGGISSAVTTFSAFGLGTTLLGVMLAEHRLLFSQATLTSGRVDLFSYSLTAGGLITLSDGLVGTIAWDGVLVGQRTLFSREHAGPPIAVEILSVPTDRSSPPISITSNSVLPPLTGEFQDGLFPVGDLVVYARRSTPNAMFAAFASQPGSEQLLPVLGHAMVRFPVTAPGAALAERLLLSGRVDAGQQTYTDLWSARENPPGQLELLRLSRQGDTNLAPDGTGITLWNDVLKAGRIVFSRGADLYSVDPAVADSEVRMTMFDAPVTSVLLDATRPDGIVFCVAQGQVFSASVTGSPAPVQLSDLEPGATVAALHAIAPGGRIVFRVDRAGEQALYAASPTEDRGAVRISVAGGVRDVFRFTFR